MKFFVPLTSRENRKQNIARVPTGSRRESNGKDGLNSKDSTDVSEAIRLQYVNYVYNDGRLTLLIQKNPSTPKGDRKIDAAECPKNDKPARRGGRR